MREDILFYLLFIQFVKLWQYVKSKINELTISKVVYKKKNPIIFTYLP